MTSAKMGAEHGYYRYQGNMNLQVIEAKLNEMREQYWMSGGVSIIEFNVQYLCACHRRDYKDFD